MATKLRLADQRMLEAVRDGLVSYSPGARGGHLWQRYNRESQVYRTVPGQKIQGLIFQRYVQSPNPRASGTARITDAGLAALDEQRED